MAEIRKLEKYRPISEVFNLFYQEEDTVILESSLTNSLGKYSIIGRRPYHKIEKFSQSIRINGQNEDMDFKHYVKSYFRKHYERNTTSLPLTSGAIGYFSYDYNRRKKGEIPECVLIFYDQFIIEEHESKKLYLVCNEKTQTMEAALAELHDLWDKAEEKVCFGKKIRRVDKYFDFTRSDYEQSIQKIIDYIIEGDIYIANMTQRLYIESSMKPYQLYSILRETNPSPFGAYMNYGGFQIVCASPERFLQIQDRTIVTRPIKGTRKRGNDPKEDIAMKEELKHSEKDKSELLMIVDLERNDLNKVCEPGSVQVKNLFSIESYATVHHLVAEVYGRVREGMDITDYIDAAFPGGSITGAPKRRAMEVIEELEKTDRGLYTGTIGYFSLDGDCDLNIVIRTAVFQEGVYTLGVGGGITCESDTAMEYEETLQKAKAFLDAFKC